MRPTEPGDLTDVHVWHASLDGEGDALRRLAAALSEDERARAARFVFERDRRRFVAARGMLRQILGARLGVEACRVRFGYGARGKPFLQGEEAGGGLRFNVAHSQDHALFAVASGVELGIDIEVIRPLEDAAALAERSFSRAERALVRDLPEAQRDVAFYRCWTRKEAYVKAVGAGLAHPMDTFSVSFAPGGQVRVVEDETGEAAGHWWLHDLSRLPVYAAAVAVGTGGAAARVHAGEYEPAGHAGPDPGRP